MKLKCLPLDKFQKTNYRYNDSTAPNCRLENYRGGNRISYRLPSGIRERFYISDKNVIQDATVLSSYLKEFEVALLNGYFPLKTTKNAISIFNKRTDGKPTISDCINRYYNEYNTGKRQKSIPTIRRERPALENLIRYIASKHNIKYITEITTDVIASINKDIETSACSTSGKLLVPATIKTYKKILKAFLNCMIDYEVIEFSDCKTTKITTTFYKKGKADPLATTRLVCIPQEVIGAVKQYPYSTHHYLPDVKGLFLLTAEAGLRRSELLTLSTQNLYPTPECFTEIRLFDKDDCPTKYQVGFTVKSQNSIRNIPLSKNSIDFITQQIEKHKNHKIYGVVGNRRAEYQLVEYPFLFPWLDRHLNKWLRLDDFGKSFHSLINFAMEKAGLTLSERYKLHDLRRSVNLWLRKTGFTGEESAYWLGHSKETNETSYLSVKNKQELLYRQTSKDAKELLDFGLPNLKLINNS